MIKWLGGYKVMEECGELVCELAKAAPFPSGVHPDGKGDLVTRVEDEIADVLAACEYFVRTNGLNMDRIIARSQTKLAKYMQWGLTGFPDGVDEPAYDNLPSHEHELFAAQQIDERGYFVKMLCRGCNASWRGYPNTFDEHIADMELSTLDPMWTQVTDERGDPV
jgi:NTP pyrophosphatase (non-canonical NTP hydrolase)